MSTVHISLNELENASYKALESLKCDEGFCVALSKDLTFLEAAGLSVIPQFVEFLLSYNDIMVRNTQLTITPHGDEADPVYTCNGNNMSCIHFIEPLIEYIAFLAHTFSHFKVRFCNSYDYVFLIPYLQKFSPIPLTFHWQDKRKKYNSSFMFPEKQYPEFFFNVPKGTGDNVESMLVAHASFESRGHAQSHYYRDCLHIGVEKCTQYFQRSIVQGLSVAQEQWDIIQKFEKAVFVPSSDVSRGGAGENKHAVDAEDTLF